MENYRQQALFILAPKDENYKPDMDWIKNSNALEGNAKKLQAWDRHEYNLTKSVMLSIDSVYIVVLRVYGKLLEGTGTANKTEHLATLDCQQMFGKLKTLSTKSWTCLNGDQISAEDVCDTIHHCNDSSDERPFLCKGEQTPFLVNLSHSIYTIIAIGIIIYVFTIWPEVAGKVCFMQKEVPEHPSIINARKECFLAIRTICKDVKVIEEEGSSNLHTSLVNELERIHTKYHDGSNDEKRVIHETIHDFSLQPEFEQHCHMITDTILKFENNIHKIDREKPTCTKQTLEGNPSVAGYILIVINRHSFFSQKKQSFVGILKSIFCSGYQSVLFYTLVSIIVLSSLKNVIVSYLDVLVDINVYSSLRHIMENIVVDNDKHRLISNMPIDAMGKVYVGSGILSQLGVFLIYIAYLKRLLIIDQPWYGKAILATSVFFPTHFILLSVGKSFIYDLKLKNELHIWLKKAVSENNNVDSFCARIFGIPKTVEK